MEVEVIHDGQDLIAVDNTVILSMPMALADGYKAPSTTSVEETTLGADDYVKWGTNDTFPNELKKDAEGDTVLLPGLRLSAQLLYGGGLTYGKTVIDEKGKRDWQYMKDKRIDKWMRDSNVARQLFTVLYDLKFFGMAFPMFTMSMDGRSIARVSVKNSRALYTRLGKVNKYGEHDTAIINADFGSSYYKADNNTPVKCAPEFGAVDWIREKVKKGESFILPIKNIDSGRQHYTQPDWNSAREMGWVKIGKDVAKLNSAVLNKSMRPMWHIEVHPEFWPTRFGKETWLALNAAGRLKKIEEFHTDLSGKLSGVDNAGSYISTPLSHVKGFEHQAFGLVKITALENKLEVGKDGWYLTTSREAGQHKVVAMGLDSSMVGTIPGDGGMGAGSGSNNRVAFNQRVLLSKADQDMYVHFMYMVAEYNGWPDDIEFVIDQGLITTLDAGAEASAPQAPKTPAKENTGGVNG